MPRRILWLSAALLIALATTACGGGGKAKVERSRDTYRFPVQVAAGKLINRRVGKGQRELKLRNRPSEHREIYGRARGNLGKSPPE